MPSPERVGPAARVSSDPSASMSCVRPSVALVASDARSLVARLGTTTDVLVADVDLAPGEPIEPSSSLVAVPTGLAPASALAAAPVEAVAGRRIAAGAIVTSFDLEGPTATRADEASIAVASATSAGQRHSGSS